MIFIEDAIQVGSARSRWRGLGLSGAMGCGHWVMDVPMALYSSLCWGQG